MPESHTQLQENKGKEGEAEEKTKLLKLDSPISSSYHIYDTKWLLIILPSELYFVLFKHPRNSVERNFQKMHSINL